MLKKSAITFMRKAETGRGGTWVLRSINSHASLDGDIWAVRREASPMQVCGQYY